MRFGPFFGAKRHPCLLNVQTSCWVCFIFFWIKCGSIAKNDRSADQAGWWVVSHPDLFTAVFCLTVFWTFFLIYAAEVSRDHSCSAARCTEHWIGFSPRGPFLELYYPFSPEIIEGIGQHGWLLVALSPHNWPLSNETEQYGIMFFCFLLVCCIAWSYDVKQKHW